MTNQKFINIFKDSRTNWKYILIIAILAGIVGGGILTYQHWWLPKQEAKLSEVEPSKEIIEDEISPVSRICYAGYENNNAILVSANVDGSDKRILARRKNGKTDGVQFSAIISPDHRKILYFVEGGGIGTKVTSSDYILWAMNSDGTNLHKVSKRPPPGFSSILTDVCWSSDEKYIVYQERTEVLYGDNRMPNDERFIIEAMNTQTGEVRKITSYLLSEVKGFTPEEKSDLDRFLETPKILGWSSEKNIIYLYTSYCYTKSGWWPRYKNHRIIEVNAVTGEINYKKIDISEEIGRPLLVFSPDFNKLAYIIDRSLTIENIINDSKTTFELEEGILRIPIFSPNNTSIVYHVKKESRKGTVVDIDVPNSGLYILDINTGKTKQIYSHTGFYEAAGGQKISFSPDGHLIFYSHSNQANPNAITLEIIRLDGTPPVHIASGYFGLIGWLIP